MNIAIIGCGVIGLSCGVVLAQRGYNVTIVSRPKSGREVITSSIAAAFWFPYMTSVESDSLFSEADLAGPTLDRFLSLLSVPEAGVTLVKGIEFVGAPAGASGLPRRWWHDRSEVAFRELTESEIPIISDFGTLQAGCEFRIPVVHMERHLVFLTDEFLQLGGILLSQEIQSLDQPNLNEFDAIVNCAGLDAQYLAHDNLIVAVRGQVVSVRDICYSHNTLYFIDQGENFDREPVYIVPRGSDVILGGTAEIVSREHASLTSIDAHLPDPEVTLRIIKRCALLRPEFMGTFQHETKVGLRPCRSPVRIGVEESTYILPVVHCYGHGGGGVTLSWGSALIVERLTSNLSSKWLT